MSTFSPAITRLHQALSTNITTCCEEINRIIHECGIKELESIFPVLLNSIFELNPQGGWGLRTTRSANSRLFDQVRYMLSPNGPILELCYKLMSDQHIKYEFPLSCLPASTRQLLDEGIVPPFYAGKIHLHPQSRAPSSLILNPFEFYMLHFTYYLVNPTLPSQQFSNTSSDILYLVILEDYLKYFLPCDGSNPPSIPAPMQPLPSTLSTPVKPSSPAPVATLLKKSVLMPTNVNKPALSYTVDKASEQDTWRTHILLQSILENWLSQVSPKDRTPRPGSPSSYKPYNESIFLPGLDHLRAIRMTIKHLHYFVNSAGPNIITGLDKLKRTVWSGFQKKLYLFMRHTMEHWPLDASFRLFLETWLSYVQPWRYTARNSDEDRFVEARYQTFVAENLLFYTNFLHKMMLRFLRLDLASAKDALMLYRVAKVFTQGGLKELIAAAESSFVEGMMPSHTLSSQLGITVRQSIDELEGPSFSYCSLFSLEVQVIARQLLGAITLAKLSINSKQLEEQNVLRSGGLVSWIKDFVHNVSLPDDSSAEDPKKILAHLEFSLTHFAHFFNLEVPEETELIQRSSVQTPRTPATGRNVSELNSMETTFAQSVTQPRIPTDAKYRGNPDTATIRTYEIAGLVRFFHKFCTKINDKYGRDLELMYYRSDFTGRVMRQVLAAPCVYEEIQKRSNGTPVVARNHLPPRLSLRFLAHKQVLGYICGFCLLFYVFGWPVEISLCFLIAGAAAIVFVRASLKPLLAEFRNFEDSSAVSISE